MEALWWIIAGSLVVIGIAGTVLPALPGIVLVFLGLALAAWTDDFQRVGGATIAILGMFTLLAYLDRVCRHQLGLQEIRRQLQGSRRCRDRNARRNVFRNTRPHRRSLCGRRTRRIHSQTGLV
jgi:Protein of unknown function (DUF456)